MCIRGRALARAAAIRAEDPDVVALLAEIAAEEERLARTQAAQSALLKAEGLLESGNFEEAAACAESALASLPDAPQSARACAELDRLLALLQAHDPLVRDPAGRRLEPSPVALRGRGQMQLLTDLGPLDILCRLHDGRGYQELAQHSVAIEAGDLNLKVIDLPTLIEIKSNTGRVRDRLVVPLLLALLREREKPPQG